MPGTRRRFIDGYNVIRTNPTGSRIEQVHGTRAARQWLIDLCSRTLADGEHWTVVFDGDGAPLSRDAGGATLTVRYAAPLTADDVIRDLAFHAHSVGASCTIVSSDRDVRLDGCEHQGSDDFYDSLLRYSGQRAPAPAEDAGKILEKLLAYLSECGHIDTKSCIATATRTALEELIAYHASEKLRPQKLARDIENILREGVRLSPWPDPEKMAFRSIKHFFEDRS
jgi:hypothetical protein